MDDSGLEALNQHLWLIVEKSKSHVRRPPPRSARAQAKDPILETGASPERRRENAREIVASAMRLVREACGEDVLRDAYGLAPSDRREGLLSIAARTHLAAHVFATVQDQDCFSLGAVASEAEAVGRGDQPILFGQLSSKKIPWRVLHARFSALRWDAILEGAGLNPAERQELICRHEAFGQTWDTVRKWRGMADDQWGKERVARILEGDRQAGLRGLNHTPLIRRGEKWEDALVRAGKKFSARQKGQ